MGGSAGGARHAIAYYDLKRLTRHFFGKDGAVVADELAKYRALLVKSVVWA